MTDEPTYEATMLRQKINAMVFIHFHPELKHHLVEDWEPEHELRGAAPVID